MSSDPSTTTNATTATAATVTDQLPMRETALIGILQAGDEAHALLRLGSGRVLTVTAGGLTSAGRIKAIGDSYVVVSQFGRESRLDLPQAA